jgi:hypothetical protein
MLLCELTLNSGCDYRSPSQVHHREKQPLPITPNDPSHHGNSSIHLLAPVFIIQGGRSAGHEWFIRVHSVRQAKTG